MVKLEEFDKSAGCPIRERNFRRKSETVTASKSGLLVVREELKSQPIETEKLKLHVAYFLKYEG